MPEILTGSRSTRTGTCSKSASGSQIPKVCPSTVRRGPRDSRNAAHAHATANRIDPELAPPHGQYHQAYEQRYAQVAGWVGQFRRRSQDRSQKIDAESCDHTRLVECRGRCVAARRGSTRSDSRRLAAKQSAGREQPGRCHANSQ